DFEKALQFMERRGFDMPVYHYRSRSLLAYESTVIPTTYVITKDGRLALEKRGLARYDTREFKDFMLHLADL
ncbi:MAG: TlpA family protein disulfide reductase, partial [Balneolaceae bacterium]